MLDFSGTFAPFRVRALGVPMTVQFRMMDSPRFTDAELAVKAEMATGDPAAATLSLAELVVALPAALLP